MSTDADLSSGEDPFLGSSGRLPDLAALCQEVLDGMGRVESSRAELQRAIDRLRSALDAFEVRGAALASADPGELTSAAALRAAPESATPDRAITPPERAPEEGSSRERPAAWQTLAPPAPGDFPPPAPESAEPDLAPPPPPPNLVEAPPPEQEMTGPGPSEPAFASPPPPQSPSPSPSRPSDVTSPADVSQVPATAALWADPDPLPESETSSVDDLLAPLTPDGGHSVVARTVEAERADSLLAREFGGEPELHRAGPTAQTVAPAGPPPAGPASRVSDALLLSELGVHWSDDAPETEETSSESPRGDVDRLLDREFGATTGSLSPPLGVPGDAGPSGTTEPAVSEAAIDAVLSTPPPPPPPTGSLQATGTTLNGNQPPVPPPAAASGQAPGEPGRDAVTQVSREFLAQETWRTGSAGPPASNPLQPPPPGTGDQSSETGTRPPSWDSGQQSRNEMEPGGESAFFSKQPVSDDFFAHSTRLPWRRRRDS